MLTERQCAQILSGDSEPAKAALMALMANGRVTTEDEGRRLLQWMHDAVVTCGLVRLILEGDVTVKWGDAENDWVFQRLTVKCSKCNGEGRVADSDDQEPWSAWENLPPGSDLAVRIGAVKPMPCPACNGKGVKPC